MIVALAVGIAAGVLLPIQTTINTRLGRRAGSVFSGSFISFTVGTFALALALVITRPRIDYATLGAQSWWVWIGGACGVIFLSFNMVLMRALGASASVVLPIVGQVVGGVLIDGFGLFATAAVGMSPVRLLGTAAVIVGAVLVNVTPHARGHATPETAAGPSARARLLLALLALGTGALSSVQSTVNGKLGVAAGSALVAAFVSFAIGLVVLAVIVVATRAPLPIRGISRTEPRWIWIGGFMGAVFVLVNAAIVPILGTGLTVSVVLLGQILAGIGVDQFGILGATKRPVTVLRVVGTLLVFAGVVLVRVA